MTQPIIGSAVICLAVLLSGGATSQAQNKKAPPKAVPVDPQLLKAAETPAPAAPSTDPWFKWDAQVKVDLGGPEPQTVKRHGRVQATDMAAARKKAVGELEAMIASQFEGLAKLMRDTLKMEVTPLADPGVKPRVADHHNVQIFASVTCFSAWEFESGLPFVGGKKKISSFILKGSVEADGKTDTMEGSITNFGIRNAQDHVRRFLLWQGPVYLDDRGTAVTVKLDQFRARVDIGPEGWPEETTTIGKFRVTVRNQNGRLVASVQPLEHVKVVGNENALVTRTTMNGGENSYRATIVVTSPEETATARAEAKKKQDERNQAMQPGPNEAVEVFSGSVTQDINDKLNKRRSEVGLGRVIVMTTNAEAGAAYVNRVYPNKQNLVKIVKDRKEAEEYLQREWQDMLKKPPFSSYEFIPGTQRVNLTPKKGETVLDRLSDMPKRKRP